ENVRDLHHLGAGFGIHRHLHHHQFTVDILVGAKVLNFQNVHQLFELLDDLFQRRIIAAGDDGHAGGVGILGGAYIQGVNIIATASEQAGHAREHTEFVFHENRDCMSHNSHHRWGRKVTTTQKRV